MSSATTSSDVSTLVNNLGETVIFYSGINGTGNIKVKKSNRILSKHLFKKILKIKPFNFKTALQTYGR